MADVTQIFSHLSRENQAAAEELFPLVYDELRRLAASHLAQEKPGHTLQATALVHEVYLRLAGSDIAVRFNGRSHFFAVAAEAMRRILVDSARRRAAEKRGGDQARIPLDESLFTMVQRPDEAIAVDDALDALTHIDSQAAELVKLHYFGGFSLEEAGRLLGMSRATSYRTWAYARAWLFATLAP